MLPFTREAFFAVFADYNMAIWPAQVVAYGLGLVALLPLAWRGAAAHRAAAAALAILWLWTGVAYHGLWFAPINSAAFLFAGLFVVEGALLLLYGVARHELRFAAASGPASLVGAILVLYAGVLYPIIGSWSGHGWPAMPMFGVTPCPVTLFTFGMLLLVAVPVPPALLVIPALWSLIGGTAAFLLAVPQDWLLLVSGFLAVPLVLGRNRALRQRNEAPG